MNDFLYQSKPSEPYLRQSKYAFGFLTKDEKSLFTYRKNNPDFNIFNIRRSEYE